MARGRKRKAGKRHPCGKLVRPTKGETQAQILATVVEARQRHYGVSAAQARDQRLSSALGRLAFTGAITQQQYEAGQKFGEVYHRHQVVTGLPLPSPSSVAGLMASAGSFGGSGDPPDIDLIERVRRHYDAALRALKDCDHDRDRFPGQSPSRLVYRIVCLDEDAGQLPQADQVNLQHGLDGLGYLFGLVREAPRKVL
ncbi:hypothetical protein [Brevundimonas sp.]|uniref:hypothetical protein n=1 Tax=Brevundimonas sp. TaxID=1871086 RepID=UPI003A94AB9B